MSNKIRMTQQQNLSIEKAMELYIRKAKVRNLSEDTLRTYQCHFNIFIRYINKETPISDVTSECLDGFIIYLRSTSKANEITINTYLRTMRAFLYFCMDCGYLEQYKIVMPKVEKKVKETYTDQELERLMKKPNINKCSFTEYRIWFFENYLPGTGNRLSSALNVRIKDIDFDSASILIRKTKKQKTADYPLSHTLSNSLISSIQNKRNA